MQKKNILQIVDLSKKARGIQPILIKDDPNHTLLSVYEDLKKFFTGNIKLAIPKKQEGKSWKDTEKIKYFSPVEGAVSKVPEYEYEQQIKPALKKVQSQLEDPDLDRSDPDELEKLYITKAFKFPENDLKSHFVKVGSHYVLCNWGLENAPKIDEIVFEKELEKPVNVQIKLGGKGSPYILKAEISESEIETCEWKINNQELKGEKISRSDLDIKSLPESFHVNVDVETKDGRRASDSRYTTRSEIQNVKESGQISAGFESEDDDFVTDKLENDDFTNPGSDLEGEQYVEEEQEKNEIIAWFKENWKRIVVGLLIFFFILWLISQCDTGPANTTSRGVSGIPQKKSVSPGFNNSGQNTPNNVGDDGSGGTQGSGSEGPDAAGSDRKNSNSRGSGEGTVSSKEPLLRDKDSQTRSKQKQLPSDIKAKPMEEVGTIYRMEYQDGYLYWLEVDGERHLLKFVPNKPDGSLYQGENSNQIESF